MTLIRELRMLPSCVLSHTGGEDASVRRLDRKIPLARDWPPRDHLVRYYWFSGLIRYTGHTESCCCSLLVILYEVLK